jgi:hypothetical protein
MRLLEASSVPVTAKDWLGARHIMLASGYGMSDPETTPLEIWSAPVNSPIGVGLVGLVARTCQLLKLGVVGADVVGADGLEDEPQARRAASGDRRRRRSPGCMGGMIRLAGLSGMKKWVGLRVPGYTYCII